MNNTIYYAPHFIITHWLLKVFNQYTICSTINWLMRIYSMSSSPCCTSPVLISYSNDRHVDCILKIFREDEQTTSYLYCTVLIVQNRNTVVVFVAQVWRLNLSSSLFVFDILCCRGLDVGRLQSIQLRV